MNADLKALNIKWDVLGAQLANLSDEEQRAFLRGFAQEMNKYPTEYQRDLQLAAIMMGNEHQKQKPFTNKEREVFQYLGEFCKEEK
jgi:hypothetical protein